MTKVIGITGSIATGKSTVVKYLIDQGYTVLDSDAFAKEALTIDFESIEKVKQTFDCVVDHNIDRKKLGRIIFNNEKAKKQLEDIVHPYVIKKLHEGVEKNIDKDIVFLDIPLLYECHLEYLCDTIVVVYCDLHTQITRLIKRDGIEETYAKTMIDNQMSIEDKKKMADIVLDNSKTHEYLLEQLQKLW